MDIVIQKINLTYLLESTVFALIRDLISYISSSASVNDTRLRHQMLLIDIHFSKKITNFPMNYKFEYWYNKLEITKIVYVKKQLLELANFDSLNLLGFLYRNEKRFLFVLLKGTN